MKKLLYVLMAMLIMISITACGESNNQGTEQDNKAEALPAADATQEEISEDFDFAMVPPNNAKDAKWSVIDECIGQLTFKLDGQNVCFRMTTDEMPEGEAEAWEMLKTVAEINEELEQSQSGKVEGMNIFMFFNSGKSGAAIWYNENGTIYTVEVDKKASAENLSELAELLSRPVYE